jgi:hypothetical protein
MVLLETGKPLIVANAAGRLGALDKHSSAM